MNTDENGIRAIACREAWCGVPYLDGKYKRGPKMGQPRWSWAFGNEAPPDPNATISFADSLVLLRQQILIRDADIDRNLKVPVSQHQHNALCSLYYQDGTDAELAVINYFNNHQPELAMGEFTRWNKDSDGNIREGLAHRRNLEVVMARAGLYLECDTFLKFPGNPRMTTGIETPFPSLIN